MTSRERTLATGLFALTVLGGGGLLAYQFVYVPLGEKRAAADKLRDEIAELDRKSGVVVAARPRIVEAKRQSLPPDPEPAKSAAPGKGADPVKPQPQYKQLLERLLLTAGIQKHDAIKQTPLDNKGGSHPQLGPNQPAYTRLGFTVDAYEVDVWQVADFLRAFYRLDLLHQITEIGITRDDRTDARNGLKLHLVIEALILDGAEPRASLFPVTNATGAVAGFPAAAALARTPEAVRGLTPVTATPVLSPRNRDYSYLAWKDIFYGVLPDPRKPTPLSIDRLGDVVLNRDEKGAEVRVRLKGDGASKAELKATVAGSLLPPGPLKVDPKTLVISVPPAPTEDVPDDATSTVAVEVTTPDGPPVKGSFTVSLAKPKEVAAPPPAVDIAGFIKLTGLVARGGAEESVLAIIRDDANPFRYEVTVGAKRVEVVKLKPPPAKQRLANEQWRKDRDYEHPPGVLAFSDDFSGTKRTFKVVAVEADALILSEAAAPPAPKEAPKGPRGARPKQGDPLAAVAGAPAVAVPATVLYRWSFGKSLKDLTRLTPADAAKVLKRVAESGPLGVPVAKGN